uniref:Uncharacterized protein n=1 Tax=Trieres chinensis TaxID=1514140 RepID=A0A7S1ZT76_TRICV|mmetsp:Transcript_32634/g.66700  ORF Transcript_32634/g.66700 Transcript_32634/m.66700 type:complete len:299 (+) Transcript_32634:2-898(+)
MMQQMVTLRTNKIGIVGKLISWINIGSQRFWDGICPLFLQRMLFTPSWNRRNRNEIIKFITKYRSQDFREHRSTFHADWGRGRGALSSDQTHSGRRTSPKKVGVGILIALGSFSICSPHFQLNMLTVFCCSIALGMSMSLQYMEIGRGTHIPGSRSILRPMRLNVIVIASLMVGQLVGSSGGILFLAEFVVTTVSLILGGAATISTNAVESWVCFFCLSSTAFCGYLFARVGLVDGMRKKRCGSPSLFLCISLTAVVILWLSVMLLWDWELPFTAMIVRSWESQQKKGDVKNSKAYLQ